MENTIKLGSKVEDLVSGFQGIATAKIEYINGCQQICIAGKSIDNKPGENLYVDIQQIKIIDEGINIEKKPTGGPQTYQPKH